ncbi:MAG TPA: cupin domain-containing protein [Thermodesulfobacteriota bacterium]|nr:cupin domain-containing protein [Thermodesulfobacteriota bacterium]
MKNIFSGFPERAVKEEITEALLDTQHFTLKRILSSGQMTPPGEWYDQNADEWVILLSGEAGLLFEGEAEARVMRPGDFVHIPAHKRHRVEWTDPKHKTVWLALHY